MAIQNLILKCPFCGKGDIEVLYVPSSVRFKKGTYGGSKKGVIRSQEKTMVQTNKCPNCGKSDKEIQKKTDGTEEKNITKEEHLKRLERLKAMGLPTKIVSKR